MAAIARPESAVGVYGLGRFGAFYAGLLARHLPVAAFSRDPRRPTPPGVRRVEEQELLELPALILCVAISALPEVLRRVGPRLRPETLVMDTASVKSAPAAWMKELLPDSVQVLATHPMFGPDSATAGLEGLPLILCPVRVPEPRVASWSRLFEKLGLTVRRMTPEEHDREAAFTQGLAHYVGRVLAAMELRPSAIATVGYRKLLEVIEQTCNDSWQLFLDLQLYNPFTGQMRRRLEESLAVIRGQLDTGAGRGESPPNGPPQSPGSPESRGHLA